MPAYKRIGERLIEAGLITPEQLEIALKEQEKTGELIGAILFSLGFISQKDLFTVLSMSYGGQQREGRRFNQRPEQEDIRTPEDMEDLIKQSRVALKVGERAVSEIPDTAQAPLVRLVDRIIITGLRKGATDVHIGPDIKGTRVRYRIDGRLQHGMFLPREILPAVVSRIKIMGSMNIAESRIPQDGGAEFSWNGRILDLRISTFPVAGGENVVIRILDKSRLVMGLENLGFFKDDVNIINKSLNMPYGMILVTGPTGSGKTTTLYSALSIINSV